MDAGWISLADDYTILVREDLPDHDDYRFIADYEGEKIREVRPKNRVAIEASRDRLSTYIFG